MKCTVCGRDIREGVRFCPWCGSAQVPGAPSAPGSGGGASSGGRTGAATAPRRPRRRRHPVLKRVLLVAAVLVVAGAVGFAAAWFLSARSDAEDGSSDGLEAYYEQIEASSVVEEDGIAYVDGQILITAVQDATFDEVEELLAAYDGAVVGYISTTNDYQVNVSGGLSYAELEALCAELEEDGLIKTAAPSAVALLSDASVDYTADPWVDADHPRDDSGSEWDASDPEGLNWWAEAIGMMAVWDSDLEFETVKVGVLDASFDLGNEDLDEAFALTWNNPDSDLSDHETHVAGIIAADAENHFGIAGIAQNAELYGYALEGGSEADDSTWGNAFMFKYAIALMLDQGVRVINISQGFTENLQDAAAGDAYALGWLETNSSMLADFLAAYLDAGYDFLICKAAGNDALDASYDIFGAITDAEVAEHIIVVGNAALDEDSGYVVASDSNTGARVDVYAPGSDILSDVTGNETRCLSGTSMAAPMVTGIVALVWGVNPDLTASQVRSIVLLCCSNTELPIVNAYSAVMTASITEGLAGDAADGILAGLMGTVYVADESGTVLEVTLEGLAITIYDEDGAAVASSDETAADEGLTAVAVSLMDGTLDGLSTYTVVLPAGTYEMELSADGYDTVSQTVVIEAGGTQVLNFCLTAAVDEEALYAAVLDVLYGGLSDQWDGWDTGVVAEEGLISPLWYEDPGAVSLDEAAYALVDLDGDGSPELACGIMSEGVLVLYDLYTLVDGAVVHLISNDGWNTYWIGADGVVGSFESGGAYLGGYDYYTLSGGSLALAESLVWRGSYGSDDENWYHSTTMESADLVNEVVANGGTAITAAEAQAILDGHAAVDPGCTALSAYVAGDPSS